MPTSRLGGVSHYKPIWPDGRQFNLEDCAMPVHDWTRVEAGIFHHFHHEWLSEITRALNHELQGTEYYALAEQIAGGLGPDVLTLQRPIPGAKPGKRSGKRPTGSVALADCPPKTRFHIKDAQKWYASRKKAVTIRHISEAIGSLPYWRSSRRATRQAGRPWPTWSARSVACWPPVSMSPWLTCSHRPRRDPGRHSPDTLGRREYRRHFLF